MKRIKQLIIIFVFINLVIYGNGIEKKTTIIYSTNPYYPPYDWSIGEDKFDGASIELLEMVIPNGYNLKAVVYPWKRSMLLAEQGDIDMLISLRITSEREKYLIFTEHRAFPNPISIFVREDKKFKYSEWKDLKPYRGGISLGDTFGGGFDQYWVKELKIEEASNMEENFRKLEMGRIDYFITSYYLGMAYIGARQLKTPIIALEKPISTLDIHFGFSKNSKKDLPIEYIDKKLAELDKKGIPEMLLKKYLEKYNMNPKIYKE